LPHELNGLVDANRKLLLNELFTTANWVLQQFARDPQWRLEGELGVLAIIHTWTQRLQEHFHVHCIVPGGAWRENTGEFIRCRKRFLFRKDSLATAFANRFIVRLQRLHKRGKLRMTGAARELADASQWTAFVAALSKQRWIVYPKVTSDSHNALDYLARYTHTCEARADTTLSERAKRAATCHRRPSFAEL
jgi:hypothetical protein